jgi:hypothetical protein
MRIRLSGLPVGSCFLGKKRKMAKKVSDEDVLVVGKGGKERRRKVKGDPEVEPSPCALEYIGRGMRRHPDQVVEIGDGKPKRIRRT